MHNYNYVFFFFLRNHLGNPGIWSKCVAPPEIVPWNLTLFSLLLIMSAVQAVLCAIQAINGILGTFCGDCKCSGCCGVGQIIYYYIGVNSYLSATIQYLFVVISEKTNAEQNFNKK